MKPRRPSLLVRTSTRFAIEPLAFARVAPQPYAPEHVLRLHRHHSRSVPGVVPRHIDVVRFLDRAIRTTEIIDRPRVT